MERGVVQGRAQGIAEPDQLVRMWRSAASVLGPRVLGTCSFNHSPPDNRADCVGTPGLEYATSPRIR